MAVKNLRAQSRSRAFTLLEILAVLLLIAIGFGVAFGAFSGKKASLKRASQQLTQDIQGLYIRSIEQTKIYRLSFDRDERHKYLIEEYRPPMKKPKEDDREAMEKWEDYQREIDALSGDERKKRTRMDRGTFKAMKERILPTPVQIEKVLTSRMEDKEGAQKITSIVFMPTGEMDQALIILKVDESLIYSLKTNPLTGKVHLILSEVTEQEWKKETQPE